MSVIVAGLKRIWGEGCEWPGEVVKVEGYHSAPLEQVVREYL
jgi:hypothetical protein